MEGILGALVIGPRGENIVRYATVIFGEDEMVEDLEWCAVRGLQVCIITLKGFQTSPLKSVNIRPLYSACFLKIKENTSRIFKKGLNTL